jgi:hypothetical protein
MNLFKYILPAVMLLSAKGLHGQDSLQNRNFFIGYQLLGPVWFASVSGGYIVDNRLHIEIGGGLVGYYGGFKYSFGNNKNPKRNNLYTGVLYASALNESAGGDAGILAGEMDKRLYFPVGLKLCRRKFYYAPELALNWFITGWDRHSSDFMPFLGFQAGVMF